MACKRIRVLAWTLAAALAMGLPTFAQDADADDEPASAMLADFAALEDAEPDLPPAGRTTMLNDFLDDTAVAETPAELPPAEMSVYAHMERMEEAFTELRRTVRDAAQRERSLELLTTLQRHAVLAKAGEPPMIRKLQGEAKAEASAYFRTKMVELMESLLAAEKAILAGDQRAATLRVLDALRIRNEGHQRFEIAGP